MSLISPGKIKHPPLPAFTLFLSLVLSIAIIFRYRLPESEAVLFHLSSCKKYHRQSIMWTVEIYFLTDIGAEKSKVKLNADSMTREEPLSGSREACFQCTPTSQKRGGSLPGLFCKSTLPPLGICLWLNHIHRPHLLIPSLWRFRFQHMSDSEGLAHAQYRTEESTPAPFRGRLRACAVQGLNEDPLLFEVLFICHWFLSVSFMLKIYFHICHLL